MLTFCLPMSRATVAAVYIAFALTLLCYIALHEHHRYAQSDGALRLVVKVCHHLRADDFDRTQQTTAGRKERRYRHVLVLAQGKHGDADQRA